MSEESETVKQTLAVDLAKKQKQPRQGNRGQYIGTRFQNRARYLRLLTCVTDVGEPREKHSEPLVVDPFLEPEPDADSVEALEWTRGYRLGVVGGYLFMSQWQMTPRGVWLCICEKVRG
jgi:hypothetical protein